MHALVTRGGWTTAGEWIPVPYVDEGSAESISSVEVVWPSGRTQTPKDVKVDQVVRIEEPE